MKLRYYFYILFIIASLVFLDITRNSPDARAQISTYLRNEFPAITQYISPKPCSTPLAYSLGTFDTRFGLSREQFLADIRTATGIWNTAFGKNLFEYSPTGKLAINLEYDYRQQATVELNKLGATIHDTKADYDLAQAQYNSLSATYAAQKSKIEQLIAGLTAQEAAYEEQVKYWNDKGGAPPAQYASLQKQKANLDAEVAVVNDAQNAFNELVARVNAAANNANRLAHELNLNVAQSNTIGTATGGEFDEGEYLETATSTAIFIYQYENASKLIRVLTHELGHSLGMQHVADPKAIMYYKNEGENEMPTAADVTELDRVCEVKN